MMKLGSHIILVFLTALILINSTKASLTYSYYELDPIGFIEALCENKDQPELQCNGNCQLKKVAESQDNSNNTPESIVDFKELVLYPSPDTDCTLTHRSYYKTPQLIAYQNLYSFINIYDCFHPPRV